jgi:protein-L-isoaspartate O-methyltransferase
MVELLDVRPDDRILEIGCGAGQAVSIIGRKLAGV